MNFRLTLDPADTLAIGDGRPFNQNDTGRAIAASIFPPPPDTVYGASRVACARALGWSGVGNWGREIADIMGDRAKPGKFSISGPFFNVDDGGLLLPIPSHVMAKINIADAADIQLISLMPAANPLKTELGNVRLLDVPAYQESNTYQPLAGRWGKAGAVLKLLSGETTQLHELGRAKPCHVSQSPKSTDHLPGWSLDDLAAMEHRVGIARDYTTHLAKEGQLFASVRRALRRGVENVCRGGRCGATGPIL